MTAASQLVPLSSPELSVKLFVADPAGVDLEELIPVFHRWIREDLLEDELPIDVAAYTHVPKGPGVVLVCDQAQYAFDARAGRLGLRYRGRRVARGSGQDAVLGAFGRVLRAASLLEREPSLGSRYRFGTDRVEFGISDRLRAPSIPETLAALRPTLESALQSLYGAPARSIALDSGPREPLSLSVEAGASPPVDALLERLVGGKR